MNSLDHEEGSEGLAVMDDRQSLRGKAQQSLAALGTCWRVGMRAWRMVDRDGLISLCCPVLFQAHPIDSLNRTSY